MKFLGIELPNPFDIQDPSGSGLELDMEVAFLRFLPRKAERLVPFVGVLAFLTQLLCLSYSRGALHTYCNLTPAESPWKFNCFVTWILSGPNQISLGLLLYTLITTINWFAYSGKQISGYLPFPFWVQWFLNIHLCVFWSLALIVYFEEFFGHEQPQEIQTDKFSILALMIVYQLLSLTPIYWNQFLVLWGSYTGYMIAYATQRPLSNETMVKEYFRYFGILVAMFLACLLIDRMKVRFFNVPRYRRPVHVAVATTTTSDVESNIDKTTSNPV